MYCRNIRVVILIVGKVLFFFFGILDEEDLNSIRSNVR